MRYIAIMAAFAAAAITLSAGAAFGAKPEGTSTKLRCFTGSGGTCTIDESAETVALDTSPAGYAGVYLNNANSLQNRSISSTDFSFNYVCADGSTTTCVAGGSPRLSIPIDSTGDGVTDAYAFIDAGNCGSTGTVGTGAGCMVFYGATTYANWDAFAAANPTYTTGDAVAFVIADQPFEGTISNVVATK